MDLVLGNDEEVDKSGVGLKNAGEDDNLTVDVGTNGNSDDEQVGAGIDFGYSIGVTMTSSDRWWFAYHWVRKYFGAR